ncbi:hypothetical protein OF83DRAFT_175566 [Amylostereum chailletii]|nr:hypothetical protein OF83DRAFT_175566 [Amylostereum chailletii]
MEWFPSLHPRPFCSREQRLWTGGRTYTPMGLGGVRRRPGGMSTEDGSRTNPTRQVREMNHPQDAPSDPHVPIPSHMNELQKSSVLWNNLKSYTERRPGVGSANRDTWQFIPNDDNDSGFAVAPADQQGWALRDILLPGYVHMNRTTTERLVDTEMQMAILVDRDIIHIVNSLLKTRYRNQSEAGAKWNERDPSVHPDLQNSRDAPFYPVWGGPVPKGHIYAGIQNNQQPEEQPEDGVHNPGNQLKKAGLPDGLLFFDMEEKSQVALYEVKVYWSYSFRLFTGMRHLTNGAHLTGNDRPGSIT